MRTLSIEPAKCSPHAASAPIESVPFDVASSPLAGALATCAPLTQRLSLEPSYLDATKLQLPSGSAEAAVATALELVTMYALGRPLSSSSPHGKPPPGRSFATTVWEVAKLVGLTQASSVSPAVGSSAVASAAVTIEVAPNDTAPPNLPAVDHVAPLRVAVFWFPDASAAVMPVPSSKA